MSRESSPLDRDAFSRKLLRSAAADRSPRGARTRALAALGAGGSSVVASATSKAAAVAINNGAATSVASAGAKVSGVLATKWLAVVVIGGLATSGIVAVETRADRATTTTRSAAAVTRATAPTSATSARPQPLAPAPLPVAAPPAEPTTSAVPAPQALAPARAPAAPPLERAPSVAAQARTLDEARATIAAGNGPRAMSLLDDFARRNPRSPLGEEALVLRIEALVASGDRYAASAAASRFFAMYPSSPYGRRVRSVVAEAPGE
jgi:hypothetical protein